MLLFVKSFSFFQRERESFSFLVNFDADLLSENNLLPFESKFKHFLQICLASEIAIQQTLKALFSLASVEWCDRVIEAMINSSIRIITERTMPAIVMTAAASKLCNLKLSFTCLTILINNFD